MTAPTEVDYWAGAACREPGVSADLFFPERGAPHGQAAAAKAVCRRCPIQQQCGEYIMALESQWGYSQRWGIWAGLGPKQRRKLARGRRGER